MLETLWYVVGICLIAVLAVIIATT